MRNVLPLVVAIVFAAIAPAVAYSPMRLELKCPLGGEEFSGYSYGGPAIAEYFNLGDNLPYGAYREQCPNGFPLYRSFTKDEVRQIEAFDSDHEWAEVVTRPYWRRVEWIEGKFGTLTLVRREVIARRIVASARGVEDAERAYRYALPIYIEHAETVEPSDPASMLEQAHKLRVIAYYSWLLGEADAEVWLARANAVFDPIRPPDDDALRPLGDQYRGFERRMGLTAACISKPVAEFAEICRAISFGSPPDFDEPEMVTLFGKFFLDPTAYAPAVDQQALECEIYTEIDFFPPYRCKEERRVIHDVLLAAYPKEAGAAIEWARQNARRAVFGVALMCESRKSPRFCEGFKELGETLERAPELIAIRDEWEARNVRSKHRFRIALEGACALRTELGLECRENGLNNVGDPLKDLEGDALDAWLRQAGRDGEEEAIIRTAVSCEVAASLGANYSWCADAPVEIVRNRPAYQDRFAGARKKAIMAQAQSLGRNEATLELGFTFWRHSEADHAERRAKFLEVYPEAVEWERAARRETIERYTDLH